MTGRATKHCVGLPVKPELNSMTGERHWRFTGREGPGDSASPVLVTQAGFASSPLGL